LVLEVKLVATWVLALLVVIGAGVGIVVAIWQPPAVYSPTAVALAYVQDLQAGDCAAATALIYPAPGLALRPCVDNPTISSPTATVVQREGHQHGFSRLFVVKVTFRSDEYGWVAYAPVSSTTVPQPVTLSWLFVVGQLPNGQYRLVPDWPPLCCAASQ
jgi:hypothetical protein